MNSHPAPSALKYSPFIFHYEGQTIILAESVYVVFGAKQAINASQVSYA